MQAGDLIERAKAFVAAVAARAPVETISAFYARDCLQEEFPNRLLPQGARRNLAELQQAMARGREVISAETYDIRIAIAMGNTVALEVVWTGKLAVGFGSLKPGDEMRAHFAQFFEFQDGLIVRQRNYDCFDPW
jgi:ketosteroid isomerase-like protein